MRARHPSLEITTALSWATCGDLKGAHRREEHFLLYISSHLCFSQPTVHAKSLKRPATTRTRTRTTLEMTTASSTTTARTWATTRTTCPPTRRTVVRRMWSGFRRRPKPFWGEGSRRRLPVWGLFERQSEETEPAAGEVRTDFTCRTKNRDGNPGRLSCPADTAAVCRRTLLTVWAFLKPISWA